MPLRYQFAAQWPDTFTWEHLVSLPGEVRVKTTKLKAGGITEAMLGGLMVLILSFT